MTVPGPDRKGEVRSDVGSQTSVARLITKAQLLSTSVNLLREEEMRHAPNRDLRLGWAAVHPRF